MEDISKVLLVGVFMLAGVLLFTPFEAVLEGVIAILFVAAVVLGFLLHPRKEVFYLRTTVRLSDPDGHQTLEQDYLAVKLELVRLWLLFLPTLLAVGFLVVSSGSGILWNFSLLNTIFSSKYGFIAIQVWHVPPLIVLVLLWAWISERWVLRDAEACAARSFSVTGREGWRVRRINTQDAKQKQTAFFKGAHPDRSSGGAENWSAGNAAQWTGSDSILECLWLMKCRFRNRLQTNVAGLVAMKQC